VTGHRLLPLLHLCDSLFPTGAFAHSDGLESATDAGLVASSADLGAWMDASLSQVLAQSDGPAVCLAWRAFRDRDWDSLSAVNAETWALRPSAVSRQASRAMGARLVHTWQKLYEPAGFDEMFAGIDVDRTMTLAPAFGVVCASMGVEAREAAEGFIYTRLASLASAAMRLLPIGQHEAHRVLAARLRSAASIVDAIVRQPAAISGFAPALDIASMSHQYVHSRLFRS
jgi:urease accessory protein